MGDLRILEVQGVASDSPLFAVSCHYRSSFLVHEETGQGLESCGKSPPSQVEKYFYGAMEKVWDVAKERLEHVGFNTFNTGYQIAPGGINLCYN